MDKIYIILLGILQSEPNDSTDYQIAHYILAHIDNLEDCSTQSIADACHVSKASISRFTRHIGLDHFNQLKQMLNNFRLNKSKFDYDIHSNQTNPLDQYIDTVTYHINHLKESIDYTIIDELIEDIHAYKHVIIAGSLQANNICLSLQFNLLTCCKMTEAKVKYNDLVEVIDQSKENTLIIVLSSTGRFFERMYQPHMPFHLDHLPKIYLITSSAIDTKYPFIYKTIHAHTPVDFASGTFQLEVIANMIALQYHDHTKNHSFRSLANSL